jgi:hypothetical protein
MARGPAPSAGRGHAAKGHTRLAEGSREREYQPDCRLLGWECYKTARGIGAGYRLGADGAATDSRAGAERERGEGAVRAGARGNGKALPRNEAGWGSE